MNFFSSCLKTFTEDLDQEAPIYDEMLASGNDMLKNVGSEKEKQELKDKLDDLANLWTKVHDESKERKDSLSTVFSKAKAREEKESDFDSWLNVTEKNLRELKPISCAPSELDAQKKELNVGIVKRGVIL